MSALSDEEIHRALTTLPEWEFDGEVITKSFVWESFRDAMDFVNDVADAAEDHDHHPDLEIYFDEVIVSLRTHSADAVTTRDVELAREIEAMLADDELDGELDLDDLDEDLDDLDDDPDDVDG